MDSKNNSKGITLVALVVTIIVLLILAAVSINLVAGGDGILGRATKATEETNKAKITEEIELAIAEIKTDYYEARYVNRNTEFTSFADYAEDRLNAEKGGIETSSGGKITLDTKTNEITFTKEGKTEATGIFNKEDGGSATIGGITIEGEKNKVTIPEGLEVGSEVTYTPSGTYTEWTTEHSGYDTGYKLASGSSYNAEDTTLTNMTISSWKVFKIDEATGEVQLVPSAPTDAKVGLKGADGYNNAVKLLNDACSSLYSNASKGITARSIKIEDIESVLEYNPEIYVENSEYEAAKAYPTIYSEEINSVINPEPEGKIKTLELSDAASEWVTGSIANAVSIRPYKTYYYLDSNDFRAKLKGNSSSLLLPNGYNTQYWVASRCVSLQSERCSFDVRLVSAGDFGANSMFQSSGGYGSYARALFPLVTLSVGFIENDATEGWSVK